MIISEGYTAITTPRVALRIFHFVPTHKQSENNMKDDLQKTKQLQVQEAIQVVAYLHEFQSETRFHPITGHDRRSPLSHSDNNPSYFQHQIIAKSDTGIMKIHCHLSVLFHADVKSV